MIKILREAKVLDLPGFEPGAFRMQSERDTTTPHSQTCSSTLLYSLSNTHEISCEKVRADKPLMLNYNENINYQYTYTMRDC